MSGEQAVLWAVFIDSNYRPEPIAVFSEGLTDAMSELHEEMRATAIAHHRQYVDVPVRYVEVWRDIQPPTLEEIELLEVRP